MSTKLSLRDALARQGKTPARGPAKSGSHVRSALKSDGAIKRPIDVARLLMAHGLSLRQAHETLNKITSGETAFVELVVDDKENIAHVFAPFSIVASASTNL
jgi:hypothetical protein